jgi:3-methyladenine DNA glycosylase AlkD
MKAITQDVQSGLSFVECINNGDSQSLVEMMTHDHIFIDLAGDELVGQEVMRAAWASYFGLAPQYKIYVSRIYHDEDRVLLLGRTTGSHLDQPDEIEIQGTLIWEAEIRDGLVARWQLHEDTPQNRKRLGMHAENEALHIPTLAAEIDARLRCLPEGAKTPDVRAIRKEYTRRLKKAPAEKVVDLAWRLRNHYGHRFVPYELLFYHKAALASLDESQVEALGQGIDSWSATDVFAHYISGPAWKAGQLTDATLERWARASDRWWRRAALVSTVYLYGDTQRTLRMCRMLVDDGDDMIVKAMSWALRALIRYDRTAVGSFLAEYDDRLAARVKREARNKLETGLKNPRKTKS